MVEKLKEYLRVRLKGKSKNGSKNKQISKSSEMGSVIGRVYQMEPPFVRFLPLCLKAHNVHYVLYARLESTPGIYIPYKH